ncbi:hypothetical protein EV424DRAFT_1344176 [Suillus variegatus]|nr:hypothetical protein EV424DRAFT_1344176 [Suillus variegatus]
MFCSNDLSKEVMIMLTWSPNMEGLYEDVFLIVWKVSKFRKLGPYRATATYMAQLAFARVQVKSGKVISTVTFVNINNSKKTILTEANNVYHFSTPQAETSGILQAQNHTGTIQEIAVSSVNRGDIMPMFILYFSDVGDSSHIMAKFTGFGPVRTSPNVFAIIT